MSGGFWDKVGNEHEHGYVCMLWLRLLAEQVQSVTWEPEGEDEPGVDAWVEENDRRIAVQCKLRETRNWFPQALIDEGIPRHARLHLEREGGADEFRFVTTTDARDLRHLRKWALGGEDAKQLEKGPMKLAEAMGLDPRSPDDAERLRDVAGRVEVFVENGRALEERLRDHAHQLAGNDGQRLIEALIALRSRNVLRRKLHADELRNLLLPEDIRWREPLDSRPLLQEVRKLAGQFVADVHDRRRIDPPLQRPESGQLLRLVRSASGSFTILVHGAAGTGKSDVLAGAIAEWPADRGLVVPVLADEAERLEEKGLTPEKLVRAAGAGRVTFLVDQLDQLLQAGSNTQKRLRRLSQLVRECRRLGCMLVVGCRTIDARHETQLHNLIRGDPDSVVEELRVGDLPEEVVTPVLTRSGIAWNRLGPDVRRLVRRPVCLGIVRDLAAADGWQGSRTLHELVNEWWRSIAAGDERREEALDAVIELMEARGTLAIDPLELHGHDEALGALERDRVLHRDSRGRLSPEHQVLIDTRLARQLGGCAGAPEVLHRLGPRAEQGLQQARRLRYAVTILANRDAGGAKIVDTLFRSEDVRPLVKRAMLLGLREERDPPAPLVRVVSGWFAEPESFEFVGGALLSGHGGWMRACREGLEAAWLDSDEGHRDAVLQLLASVSAEEGDLVAEMLGKWEQTEQGFWDRTQWAFFQDPSEDSDTLFEMRMAAPGRAGLPQQFLQWEKLFLAHPVRAAVLLGRRLRAMEAEELTQSSGESGHALPRSSQLPEAALEAADRLWSETRSWWMDLALHDLRGVATGEPEERSAPLVEMVRILARGLSHLIDEGDRDWDGLVEELPDPLRDIDGWLLLSTGAALSGRNEAAVQAAAEWIVREERFAQLHLGWKESRCELGLLRAFAETVGPHLSDDGFAAFERWILDYREFWSPEDERERLRGVEEHGELWPNERGIMAHRVLPVLPRERLGLTARARLDELERKFERVVSTMLLPFESGRGGWVGFKVPDEALLRWTPRQWLERLRQAPSEDPNWEQKADDEILTYDVQGLTRQLGHLARLFPIRFVSVAEAVATAQEELSAEVFRTLLASIGVPSRPSPAQHEEFEDPASDEDVARLLALPAFLQNDAGALELARTVRERPAYDWPTTVVERLIEIATGESAAMEDRAPGFSRQADLLMSSRLNDAACVAVRALTALAGHHPHRRDLFLYVADRLVDRDPPARRAAAAMLSMSCFEESASRARDLVLRACEHERIAAERDCLRALLFLLLRSGAPAEARDSIRGTLLRLPGSQDQRVAERGGVAAVVLCRYEQLEPVELGERLQDNPSARKGAAEQLGRMLLEGERAPWILEYAIELTEDEVSEVGDAILRHITSPRARDLLRDTTLLPRLIASRAARRGAERLLRALDEEAYLKPIAEWILELASRVLSGQCVESEAPDPLARYAEGQQLGELLARLVEECERNGDRETRARALDAWDRLLETRPLEVGRLIAERTA